MRNNIRRGEVKRTILRWYKQQGRTLPWRHISNPYRILVSEIMLQQTQVSRVLEKYPEFLRRFPSVHSLATARQRDVVHAWQGMGYNNRAVRLHKCAQAIVRQHDGRIPQDFFSLISMPGIGKYTANALLSSAFGKQLPIVDVNVQRVLSRIFWRMESTAVMRTQQEIWELAANILPKNNAYNWNQSLMDLGAIICTARNPKCDNCPVAMMCASRRRMKRAVAARVKNEPSLNGTPNRLYRGKIIEQLRQLNGTGSIRVNNLGKAILPTYTARNEAWLMKLITSLHKDGLIRILGSDATASRRVSLA